MQQSILDRFQLWEETPITTVLAGGCILLWLMAQLVDGGDPGPVTDWAFRSGHEVWDGAVWVALTAAVVHYYLFHLAFNVYWLAVLGRPLERALGSARYLGFFAAAAVVSSSVQLAFSDQTGVGLSGVLYAWFGFMWLTRRKYPEFASAVDGRTAMWLLGWFVACFFLTHFEILDVGNAAHAGGLAVGLFVGVFASGSRLRWLSASAAALLIVASCVALHWAPWNPHWLTFHARKAVVQTKDYGQAIAYADRALSLSAQHSDALWVRAFANSRLGDTEHALADLDQVVKLAPSFRDARRERARLNLLAGRFDDALADYDAMLNRDPDSIAELASRCFANWQLARISQALDDCQRASELDGGVSSTLLALVTYASGEQERGLDILRRIAPEGTEAVYSGLWLSVLAGDNERLVATSAEGWPAELKRYTLGEIDAAELRRRAGGAKPELGAAHTFIARQHERQGQIEQAIAGYRQALAADNPSHIENAFARWRLRELRPE